jgi:hypothetical protein
MYWIVGWMWFLFSSSIRDYMLHKLHEIFYFKVYMRLLWTMKVRRLEGGVIRVLTFPPQLRHEIVHPKFVQINP